MLLARHELSFPCAFTCFKEAGGWVGPAWPVYGTVAVEFAIGGLDNLLAHQKKLGDWRLYGARVVGQAVLLGGALWAASTGQDPTLVNALTLAAFGLTVAAAAIVFAVNRRAYLDDEPVAERAGATTA
jgi:hypothetical protein